MSTVAGVLNITDSQHAFISNVGQALVFDAVNQVLADYNEDVSKAVSIFIQSETDKFKFRHLLPASGKLPAMGREGAAPSMKRIGYNDVAIPLTQFGVELSGGRVNLGYLTVEELDAQLTMVTMGDLNTLRWSILTALFENDNSTFDDPVHGDLTIKRLANGDTDTYPPVLGSETEATDNHYLVAGYTVAAIADANNPVVTLRNEIAEHYGGIGSRGREFVYLHGADQTAYLAAITGYVPCSDQYVTIGQDTADVRFFPSNVPGRIHGRLSGAWLCEWDGWIPDTYGMMILMTVPAPLYRRHDPAVTGLGRGMQLVATDVNHPMHRASFENRYGVAVVNRLPAAVMLVTEDAFYTPPSAYAWPP